MNLARSNMETITMAITPEIAAEMLATNENNRDLRKSVVDSLAFVMKQGRFELSPQGIAFDKDGKLIDGQHRLSAIVESHVPYVMMRVTLGCDREVYAVLDIGKNRNIADVSKQMGLDWFCREEQAINSGIIRDIDASRKLRTHLQNSGVIEVAQNNRHFLIVAARILGGKSHANKGHAHPQIPSFDRAVIAECLYAECDPVCAGQFYQMYRYGEMTEGRNNNIVMALRMSKCYDKSDYRKRIMGAYVNFRDNTDVSKVRTPTVAAFNIAANDYINGKNDEFFRQFVKEVG